MNCAFDKEKLTGYYDGELGAAEKAEVERHIASCSECLRDLGDLKSAALLVKELPRLRAPASVAQGVTREIQAAGKVHGFAKFRRTLLWGSAVAAGLFIGLNAMYFGSLKREAPMAAHGPSVAPMARALPRENAEKAETESAAKALADRSSPQNEELRKPEAGRRELLERKSAAAVEEQKQAPGVDALKKSDGKSQDERPREKSASEPATKPVTVAPAATPAPAPAAPSTPVPATPPAPPTETPKPLAAPPAPTAKAEPAKPTAANKEATKDAIKEADKEKDAPKVEQAAAPKPDPATRSRGAALEARAELAPIHCTLSATQLTKARTRLDEALKKMGVAAAAPPPAVKAPRRETDAILTIEISDAQLAALREELEKPGDAKLQQSNPVEPVLPQFKSGGIFGGKKDAATAGAPAPKAKVEAAKEAEDAAAEPRRKVTLHLVEVKTLPADADDRAPKK